MGTIKEVCFTFALMGGMWVKNDKEDIRWLHDTEGLRLYPDKWETWKQIGYNNGWCGMWQVLKD